MRPPHHGIYHKGIHVGFDDVVQCEVRGVPRVAVEGPRKASSQVL
jgi:hypothetical protein